MQDVKGVVLSARGVALERSGVSGEVALGWLLFFLETVPRCCLFFPVLLLSAVSVCACGRVVTVVCSPRCVLWWELFATKKLRDG